MMSQFLCVGALGLVPYPASLVVGEYVKLKFTK